MAVRAAKAAKIGKAGAGKQPANSNKKPASKSPAARPVVRRGGGAPAAPATKTVNLALQGGGSHGAFTWGVLDRLLDEERLVIEGISGTSAGAINGAMLAQGYYRDGRRGARHALAEFWQRVGGLALFAPPQRSVLDRATGNWNIDRSPLTYVADLFQYALSPYQANPMGVNPLHDLLKELLVPADIQASKPCRLFVAATNVETGKVRVFRHHEITVEAVMASATLPFVYQAAEIDGLPYWDGGYKGNPVIWPMIYECQSRDMVLVQINPFTRPGTPKTPVEIINRVNEISFNSSLMSELRAIAFVQRLLNDGLLKEGAQRDLRHINMHMIENEAAMIALGAASKMNPELDFLLHLRDLGRAAADAWLSATWDRLGKGNSIDLRAMLG